MPRPFIVSQCRNHGANTALAPAPPPPHPPVAHVAKTGAVELLAAPIRGYAQSLYHRHPKLHVQEQVSDGTDSVGILNAVLLS